MWGSPPQPFPLYRVQVGSQGTIGSEEHHNHASWARTHLGGGCYRYEWGPGPWRHTLSSQALGLNFLVPPLQTLGIL